MRKHKLVDLDPKTVIKRSEKSLFKDFYLIFLLVALASYEERFKDWRENAARISEKGIQGGCGAVIVTSPHPPKFSVAFTVAATVFRTMEHICFPQFGDCKNRNNPRLGVLRIYPTYFCLDIFFGAVKLYFSCIGIAKIAIPIHGGIGAQFDFFANGGAHLPLAHRILV